MDTIHFTIVTPEGRTYEKDVIKVTVPTQAGDVTIYPKHAHLISVLRPGEIVVHENDAEPNYVAVSGGILAVRPDGFKVQVLADTAERAEQIDIERAEAARKRAEELLAAQKNVEDVDYARLQAQIEKELARIQVGNRYRNLSIK